MMTATAMTTRSFDEFTADAHRAGYDEAVVRAYEPHIVIDTHSHGFDADAIVMQGEMWLTRDGGTQHLRVGDGFTLPRGESHSERYGADGAVYWVARRNG